MPGQNSLIQFPCFTPSFKAPMLYNFGNENSFVWASEILSRVTYPNLSRCGEKLGEKNCKSRTIRKKQTDRLHH